nr:response regulator transcription factor [Arthrobacter echini]
MDLTVRVVLVDDDSLVRAGLRLILGGCPSLEIVGEASDGREALTLIEQTVPDVVLMNIRMPTMDGLAATRALHDRGDSARVIVLTTFDTDDMVLTALRYGASGFLLKDTPPADLVDAVRRVSKGEPILSPSVTAQLIATVSRVPDDRRKRAVDLLAGLTEREQEVAVAIGRGLTNAQIAADLYLSVPTVKTHTGSIFTKLGVSNRVQIARYVHDAELK